MTHDLPLVLAAALYMVSAALLYHSIGKRSARLQSLSFSLAVTGAVLHIIAQYAHWFREDVPDVSIAPLLSLCALVIIVILLLSSVGQRRFFAAGLVAMPIAKYTIEAQEAQEANRRKFR